MADTRQMLKRAQVSLERLMETVLTISPDAVVDARAPSDLDAWLRWSGARLQDIVVTISRALECQSATNLAPYRHPKMTPMERSGSWPDAV